MFNNDEPKGEKEKSPVGKLFEKLKDKNPDHPTSPGYPHTKFCLGKAIRYMTKGCRHFLSGFVNAYRQPSCYCIFL